MTAPTITPPPDTSTNLRDYIYADTAIGGLARRNHVVAVDAWRATLPAGAPDVFSTPIHFTKKLCDYLTTNRNSKGNPSVGGYQGDALATEVWYDLDGADGPEQARTDAIRLIDTLDARYPGVGSAIRIYFSGGKGFHLIIPASLFGGFEPGPCRPLAARVKRLAFSLIDGLPLSTIDASIYDATRLRREPNTRHGRTGRFKIPITGAELRLPIDQIIAMAQQPRGLDLPAADDWMAVPELVTLWQQAEIEPTAPIYRGTTGSREAPGQDARKAGAAALATSWPGPGNRHAAYMATSGALQRTGWADEDVEAFLEDLARETMEAAEAEQRTQSGEWSRIVADGRMRLIAGELVMGWPSLAGYIGDEAVTQAQIALGLRSADAAALGPSLEEEDAGDEDDFDDDPMVTIRLLRAQLAATAAENDALRQAAQAARTPVIVERPADAPCPDCAAKDRIIAVVLAGGVEVREERDFAWEILRMKGSTAPLRAAAWAWHSLRAAPQDAAGYRQLYRLRLADDAGLNEGAAGAGMAILRAEGLIDERYDPDDHSAKPRKQQKLLADHRTGIRTLRDYCRRTAAGYVEKRGRPRRDAPQSNIIQPCATDPTHPIDAICRIDGMVVQANLVTTPAGTLSRPNNTRLDAAQPLPAPTFAHAWVDVFTPTGGFRRVDPQLPNRQERMEPPPEVLRDWLSAGDMEVRELQHAGHSHQEWLPPDCPQPATDSDRRAATR